MIPKPPVLARGVVLGGENEIAPLAWLSDCEIGRGTKVAPFAVISAGAIVGPDCYIAPHANLYGCRVGPSTKVCAYVDLEDGVLVGARCKIRPHSHLCHGVVIEDEVFVGPRVVFTNDRAPKAVNPDGSPLRPGDWEMQTTLVQRGAVIGAGCVICPGVTIGERAFVLAGSVVVTDVPADTSVGGNPARRTMTWR